METKGDPTEVKISARVAQGSVGGPTIWNIHCDGLLRLELPKDVILVGYDDDVAMVAVAATIEELEWKRKGCRALLATVVHSMLLYGSPLWGAHARNRAVMNNMAPVQRQIAVVISRYHTISMGATLLLARQLSCRISKEKPTQPYCKSGKMNETYTLKADVYLKEHTRLLGTSKCRRCENIEDSITG